MFVLRSICLGASQIHMPRCFIPCSCLDLLVYVLFAMFMLRSTCLCAPCLVHVQIYLIMCSLPCSCLDLLVYVLLALFMLRSTSLSASCLVHVSRSTCWLLCHVLLKPFYLLLPLFLVFWSFRQGVDLDLVVQVYIHTPRPISKGLDHFLLHAYVCLLGSMLYIHVCLSRLRLCHALCPPWVCVCWSLGPLACGCIRSSCGLLDATTCEIYLRGVGLLNAYPFSAPCVDMLALLALATHLAFFSSLHLCTLAYMFMHESMSRPCSNLMEL